MEATYDPIVSGPEQVSLVQLRPLARPQLGLALVLVAPSGELLTFESGTPVRIPAFGRARTMYLIDTAEHQLFLEAQLPSSDPAFVFMAHLTYRTRVADPAAIASRQIRDIGELLRPYLVGAMRAATRRVDIAHAARAEEAIEAALATVVCDRAVTVSNYHVELPVQADEAASSGRSFRETTRTLRLSEIKASQMRDLLAGGSPDLLALHLAEHPEDTGAIIEMIVAGDIAEGRNMLQAISIMYGRGGSDDEPFDSHDERRKLMDRFLARALPAGSVWDGPAGPGSDRGGARPEASRLGGSRLRGSLARSPEPPIIDVSVVEPADDESPGSGGREESPGRRAGPSPARRDPDLDDER